jgi:hypothetical protein
MLRKTLLATATAGMLAAGSLVATPASAHGTGVSASIQFGGPGWNVQIGTPTYHNPYCKPIVKTVKYWQWGRPYWRQVVVGYNCRKYRPQPVVPFFPFPGSFPGPWGGAWR